MGTLIHNNQPAPGFTLPDLEGNLHPLGNYRGKVVVLNFWSAECPHAERADLELLSYLNEWESKVALLSIASNANETPDLLQRVAAERGLPLVLHDPAGQVADMYAAVTTPHLFVIDGEGILRYQGAFDDVNFRQRAPTQFYLRQAVEAVLAGQSPNPAQTLPYGCTIVRFK
ncbi:MAG: redoxin domain-containing protein [Anaerolineales bacterium]|nr:redoxin domain-containing protein [Anaerolineales bacterium]